MPLPARPLRRILAAAIIPAALAVGGLAYAESQPSDPSLPVVPPAKELVPPVETPEAPPVAPPADKPEAPPADKPEAPAADKPEAPPADKPESEPAEKAESGEKAGPQGKARGHRGGFGLGHFKGAIHGELLLWGPEAASARKVVFDRGRLRTLTDTSITIERPDGVSVSATVTPETKFNGTPREELKAETPVLLVQSEDHQALRVVSKGAMAKACAKPGNAEAQKPRPGFCRKFGEGKPGRGPKFPQGRQGPKGAEPPAEAPGNVSVTLDV